MKYVIAVNNLNSDTVKNIVSLSLIEYLKNNECADINEQTIIHDQYTCSILLSSIKTCEDIYNFKDMLNEEIARYEDHLANTYERNDEY